MSEQNVWNRVNDSGNEAGSGPNTALFLLPILGILLIGVAGVLLFGPGKAVEAVRGLIGVGKKSAPANELPPEPVHSQAPVRPRPRAKPEVRAFNVVTEVAKAASDPTPVQTEPRQHPRSGRIAAGMMRRDVLALWGDPDIKTTTVVRGRLIETYSYGYRPHSPGGLVMLEEGRVISTGDTTVP